MNLQTFTAPTMNECLQKVKQAMGHAAVILHTRSYTKRAWLGLVRREFVEITAGKGITVPERRRAAPANIVEPAATPRGVAISQFRVAAAQANRSPSNYVDGPATRALQTVGA